MLLSQDRNQMSAAIANAASAASLSDIRYFTQRGIFSGRILDQMGIARLRDDLDQLTATNPALAERLAMATEALRDSVRETVSQALMLYGREEPKTFATKFWRNAPLSRVEPRQVEQMRALIRQIARRCASATASRASGSARPSRRPSHLAAQRSVGRHPLPHRLETQASRPAQNHRAVRRLRLSGAGVGFLPCC